MLGPCSYLFFTLFIVTSMFEIIACYKELERWRKLIKPFSLLFLALSVLVTDVNYPLIYVGAFLGMLGDIFLIDNKKKSFFILGTIFFLLGHLSYIGQMVFVILEGDIVWWVYPVSLMGVVLFAMIALPMSHRITHDKTLSILGNLYLGVLVLVAFVAASTLIVRFNVYMIMTLIGAILFLVSDIILTIATFSFDFPRRDFYIMLTYLCAQALIVTGLSLTQILT